MECSYSSVLPLRIDSIWTKILNMEMDGWNGEDQLKTFYIIQSTVELFHWKWIFDIFDEKLSLHLQTTYICAKFFYHNIFWSTNCAMCTNILQVKMHIVCTCLRSNLFWYRYNLWPITSSSVLQCLLSSGKHILCMNILFVPYVFPWYMGTLARLS